MDTNNVTKDIFVHTSNTQRENANAIFTSEKLDKLDELVDAVNNLTINDAKYYESNTATTSEAQGDLKRNPETVTHTRNKKKTDHLTSNGNFEQKLLRNQTIPVVVLMVKPKIVQMIAPSVLAPQMFLTPARK